MKTIAEELRELGIVYEPPNIDDAVRSALIELRAVKKYQSELENILHEARPLVANSCDGGYEPSVITDMLARINAVLQIRVPKS